jgi:polyphenol oxidase
MNILEAPELSMSGIKHGFFGRKGGVSEGLYASLNCGLGSNDDAVRVRENRGRAASHLGIDADHLLTVYQIHSPDVFVVTAPWPRGEQPKADAMVTNRKGIALSVLAADCTPVLFADAQARVIGSAHAGWKGALGGVVDQTVAAMEKLGATRAGIRAVVGPCISQESYEVGPEFRERFLETDKDNAAFFRAGARAQHWQFDLPGYVVRRAKALGIAVANRTRCTYINGEDYFSYRRTTHKGEPDYGRNLSAIVLT